MKKNVGNLKLRLHQLMSNTNRKTKVQFIHIEKGQQRNNGSIKLCYAINGHLKGGINTQAPRNAPSPLLT